MCSTQTVHVTTRSLCTAHCHIPCPNDQPPIQFAALNNVTQAYSRVTCEVHKRLVTEKYALVPSIMQSARDLDPTLLCCQAAEWF